MSKFPFPSIHRERQASFHGPFSTILCAGYGSDKSHLGETTAVTREGFLQNSHDLAHVITGKGLRLEVVKNVVIPLPLPRAGCVILQFPAGEGWDAVKQAAEKFPSPISELPQ
jgi:hypothetical protein